MNKRVIKLIAPLIALIIIASAFIYWNFKMSRWDEDAIKAFFLENEEQFTDLAKQIYDANDSDGMESYDSVWELSRKGINSNLFWQFKVGSIVCYKNDKVGECDEVIITFAGETDIENRRNLYYTWGIYYSPNNEMIDFAGHRIEEQAGEQDSYEYGPGTRRVHYYTERLSDNWFFFKEGLW